MAQKLADKVVLITGGSEGIGYATAELFVQEGAFVYITGRRQEKLDEAVKTLGNDSNVSAIQADASNINDLDNIYAQIKQEKGSVDIIFANAGCGQRAPLGLISETMYDETFNTNVKGVLFLVQKMLPLFNNCGGSIILNGSVASIKGTPALSVYSATKAALRSFARCWSVDLKERNIRVNVISPGAIDTLMITNAFPKDEQRQKELINRLEACAVLGRIGRTDEVAKAVLFLASDDSSYITGIDLFVDGGTGQV